MMLSEHEVGGGRGREGAFSGRERIFVNRETPICSIKIQFR